MGLPSILGGGLFDVLAGREANKANQAANQASIEAQAANQEKGLQALTGTTPTQTVTREGGGFNVDFTPGGSADILNQSDITSAGRIGDVRGGFNFTLPDLAASKGLIQQDINTNREFATDSLNDFFANQSRKFGGLNISGEQPATIDAVRKLFAGLDLGGNERALNLLQSSQQGDLQTLLQQIQANMPLAPTLTNPSGTAANVIAQSPPPATSPDIGLGTLLPAAGSNILSVLQQQEALDAANQRSDARFGQTQDLLAQILASNRGTQGGFVGSSVNTPTATI